MYAEESNVTNTSGWSVFGVRFESRTFEFEARVFRKIATALPYSDHNINILYVNNGARGNVVG
jgi:hypothetical protein